MKRREKSRLTWKGTKASPQGSCRPIRLRADKTMATTTLDLLATEHVHFTGSQPSHLWWQEITMIISPVSIPYLWPAWYIYGCIVTFSIENVHSTSGRTYSPYSIYGTNTIKRTCFLCQIHGHKILSIELSFRFVVGWGYYQNATKAEIRQMK